MGEDVSTAVLDAIFDVLDGVSGLNNVYSQSKTDAHRLPGDIERVSVLVIRGPIHRYSLANGWFRRDYEVKILVVAGGSDFGERAAAILPLVTTICDAFAGSVTFSGLVTACVFAGAEGLGTIEWAGAEYTGDSITLNITEEGAISTAP